MQVFDPHIIIAWVFSGDLKDQLGRSWVWEALNIAVTRASKQYYLHKETKEQLEKSYDKKLAKLESMKKNAGGDGHDLLLEGEEMEVMDEEDDNEPTKSTDARIAALADNVGQAVIAYEKAADDLKNVVLDVCHVSIMFYFFKKHNKISEILYCYY